MAHENLNRAQEIEGSSDKTFGLVFAGLFLVISILPLFHGEKFRWWASVVATMFALVALTKPALLTKLNQLWMKLGLLLGKIVSPIALSILFYLIITPIGLMIRIKGKDPLRLKFDPNVNSYWIPRDPPGPPPGSLNNQY